MQIRVLCRSYFPFTRTPEGLLVQRLTSQMVRNNADVTVVLPMPEPLDDTGIPFARRLNREEVSDGQRTVHFGRVEGRTAEGVTILMLDAGENRAGADSPALFGKAAFSTAGTANRNESLLIVNHIAAPATAETTGNRQVLLLTESPPKLSPISGFDAVVIIGKALAASELRNNTPLAEHIRRGQVDVIAIPTEIPSRPSFDKRSAKAECQFALGLPVLNVPLFLLRNTDAQTLTDLLRQNVQIVTCGAESEGLAAEYPDRLALVPEEMSLSRLMDGCDICLCHSAPEVVDALAVQTLPVVAESMAEGIVDLDSTLMSGSGLLFGETTGRTLCGALREAASAYAAGNRFAELQTRLPGFTTPWSQVTDHLLSLLTP